VDLERRIRTGILILVAGAAIASCSGDDDGNLSQTTLSTVDPPAIEESQLSGEVQNIVDLLKDTIKNYYNLLSRGFSGENVGDVTQGMASLFEDLKKTYPHIGLVGGSDGTDFDTLATYLEMNGILFANFTASILGGAPDFLLADIVSTEQKNNRYDPTIQVKVVTFANPYISTFINEQGREVRTGAFSIGTTSYFPASPEFEEADGIWEFYEKFGSNSDPVSLFSLDKLIEDPNNLAISNELGKAFRYVGFSSTYQNVKSGGGGKVKFKQILSERNAEASKLHEESVVDDNENLDFGSLTDKTYNNIEVRAYLRDLANMPTDAVGFTHSKLADMSLFLATENPNVRRIGEVVMSCLLTEIANNPENYPIIDMSKVNLATAKGPLQMTIQLPFLSGQQISDAAAACFATLYPQK